MATEIGGDRLGSGKKESVHLRNYERSTHDMSYIWRSSMASGTLVPFMSELALPGDSWDIDLECDVKTLPTVGPLFGSYKIQLDVFECPIRLYNGKLHMNMLNIGMDMKQVKIPQMEMVAYFDEDATDDNTQVNPSSIFSYLDIRGLGRTEAVGDASRSGNIKRQFNAVPWLGYWEIYKNYYANKQEERGYVIHMEDWSNEWETYNNGCSWFNNGDYVASIGDVATSVDLGGGVNTCYFYFEWNNGGEPYGMPNLDEIILNIDGTDVPILEIFLTVNWLGQVLEGVNIWTVECLGYNYESATTVDMIFDPTNGEVANLIPPGGGIPQLKEFPLEHIDEMRELILQDVASSDAFVIDYTNDAPYGPSLNTVGGVATEDYENAFAKGNQEGLAIKTYQSDLLNNWISTEWIDGTGGISEVTAVDTSSDSFTMDTLNLAQKVYVMLNRIAVSGGSYDDWLDAVYTHERAKGVESPVYHGSLIKELAFEEVISNADTSIKGNEQPLGTLAGRGRLTQKHKGGRIRIKTHEPSYLMGIVSITPRVDYSQGNKWDVNLKTLDDLHKPQLDEIGYEDLNTEQMYWRDAQCIDDGAGVWSTEFKSAGKQPAWINYMTNINQTRGNFAIQNQEMFMTLNRRYEADDTGITDLTTYVDPSKFNNIFAQSSLDSQNFWVQIGLNMKARRKMSAKVIPNL